VQNLIIEHRLGLIQESIEKIHARSSIRDYDDEILVADTLFSDPVFKESISEVESRLGITLPCYKEFLALSNGWILMDEYLLPVNKIDWHRDSPWPEHFIDHDKFFPESVSDDDYFVYDRRQHAVNHLRKEYIDSTIIISDAISDVRTLSFLNPNVQFDDGECEAWVREAGGYIRFKSFKSMMEQFYIRDIAYLRYRA